MNSNEVAVNAEPGFVEKLVTKIIDNIQISINSVYIRYEDNISSIEPFAVGISFKGIQAATCNSNWETEFISDSAITHKLVLLEEISVFLDYGDKYLVKCEDFKELAQNDVHDHRYFVKPTSYRLEAVMNKDSKDLSIPQVTGKLENSEIEIGIETNQVTHILKVLEFMGIYSNFQSGVSNSDVDIEFSAEEAAIYRDIYKK